METEGVIETLARGVCLMDGHILLCRNRKAGNVYLPGGHVEFGETGAEALVREIREEMGCGSRATGFMGCAEHFFRQKGRPHAEINLIYRLEVDGVDPDLPPPCCESWIEFYWHPLAQLDETGLEPAVLRRLLPGWLAAAPLGNLATTLERLQP